MVFRVVTESNPTKAVVLLFGWYSAPTFVVRKYSRLYEERGCATITGVVSPLVSIRNADAEFDEFVKVAIAHAASILRANPGIPLLVHCFSNAGCRAVHRFDMMLETCSSSSNDDDDDDIALVRNSLKGQIFDSAPASITPGKLKNWRTSSPHACIWVNLAGWITDSVEQQFAHLQSKDAPEVEYWNAIKNSKVCNQQAFIYSDSDDLCDAEKLEEMIEIRRRQNPNADIVVKKFHDSTHVNHLKTRQEEYCEVIDTMLRKAGAL
jgi:hypothetical protein